jgi:hypothetical protein
MMIGTGGQKSRGGLSQKYIDDRRKEEQLVTHLGAFLKNDQIARHVAHWEVNCKTMQRNQFQKQRMDQLRKDFEQKTNERRRNLKELYDYEEAMYANEMRGLRQTPEQVKQSMINRVAELKEKREVARLKEVEEKLDRRFKEQADELRLVGSKIREMKTKHEQDIQMLEKQKKMEDQYVEEMIYAELWRRDIENKKKIEEVKIQEAIRKNNDRNMILADQVRDLDRKREMDSTLKHSEKQMLKEQWTEEMNRQKEQQLEELRVNKQLNHDIHTHNIEQKRLKKIEDDKIKDQDKRMVDEIVYKEKMLDHLDQEKK